jgi:hypothetical protein
VSRPIVFDLARIEAAHLAGLVGQFAELLEESPDPAVDPAVQRLVPDAYQGDAAAAREFRSLTQAHLLERRAVDAAVVLAELTGAEDLPDDPSDPALMETLTIELDTDAAHAWLRTLAAVRLVLATRLEADADADADADQDDPRFGIYEWVGYRLHVIVEALDDTLPPASRTD